MKKMITLLFLAILVLLLVILVRTFTYPFTKNEQASSEPRLEAILPSNAISRLSDGIRIPTISNSAYEETDFKPFDLFKDYLTASYPKINDHLERMVINEYGLVYRWKGKNSTLKPILLLSHYDVVPVVGYEDAAQNVLIGPLIFQPNDEPIDQITSVISEWKYPPFSGAVADGRIYGRGTLDMKGMLFSILEACESLIEEGFQPEQDVWFAFGHDEEVGGRNGAIKIREYFQQQNMHFDAVFDEGGIIGAAGTAGIERPVALIGMAEKGFLSLRIRVYGIGGHSSMPPPKSSLVLAAEIIEKLNQHQLPLTLIEPISNFLDQVGNEMSFVSRMAIANQWLFRPVLLNNLSKTPATNALVRTTTAITMAKGSDAANVLSSFSEIVVNFRILPGETVQSVVEHVKALCEDYETEIDILQEREPSRLSPADSHAITVMKRTLNKVYPEALPATYITIGGTDAGKYEPVSENVYRLMPIMLNDIEQGTIHNENESISIENYGRMITYFKELMRNYHQ